MSERCEHCGVTYREFRTGLTYYEVSEVLWQETLSGDRRWKTRHTILGKWREIKTQMWVSHLEECEQHATFEPGHSGLEPSCSEFDDYEPCDPMVWNVYSAAVPF